MLKPTCLENVHCWSRFQPDRGIDFNGFLWVREGGNVLIDPMPTNDDELASLRSLGGARWILLTNFDHLRATRPLKNQLGAEVLAPAGEHDRFGPEGGLVDHWFASSADLPEDLREDVGVYPIHGGKSEVEVALLLRPARALVFGDAVRSHVAGELRLLPDPKLADRARVVDSLRPLRDLPFDGVLLGDGDNILWQGHAAFEAFLDGLG